MGLYLLLFLWKEIWRGFPLMDFFAPIFKQNLKKRKHDAESGRELDALQGVYIFRQEKDN